MVIQESQENYFIDTVLIVERFANTTNWTRCSLWINMEVICIHQHDFSSHECFFKQWWPCFLLCKWWKPHLNVCISLKHYNVFPGSTSLTFDFKITCKAERNNLTICCLCIYFSNTGLMKLMCTSNLIKIRLLWLCSRCSNAKLHVVQDISKSCSTSG